MLVITYKKIFGSSRQFIPLDCFEGQSADGSLVPVIPGGGTLQLNFHNRREYVEAVLNYRLQEMNRQVKRIQLYMF